MGTLDVDREPAIGSAASGHLPGVGDRDRVQPAEGTNLACLARACSGFAIGMRRQQAAAQQLIWSFCVTNLVRRARRRPQPSTTSDRPLLGPSKNTMSTASAITAGSEVTQLSLIVLRVQPPAN